MTRTLAVLAAAVVASACHNTRAGENNASGSRPPREGARGGSVVLEVGLAVPIETKGKKMTNSEKVVSVVQEMSSAMELGDIEAVLAAYERGASLVVQPGKTASGPELREALSGFISMKPKFNMPRHEVIESGDIALHISPWTMDAVDPATGSPVRQGGLSLAVFRRQPDGNWLMVIDNPYGAALLSE